MHQQQRSAATAPSERVYVTMQRHVVHHTTVWFMRSVHRTRESAVERVCTAGCTVWQENSATFVINSVDAVRNDTQADYMILPATVQS